MPAKTLLTPEFGLRSLRCNTKRVHYSGSARDKRIHSLHGVSLSTGKKTGGGTAAILSAIVVNGKTLMEKA